MEKETKEMLEMLIEVFQKKSVRAEELVSDENGDESTNSLMKGVSWGFFLAKRAVEILIEDGEFECWKGAQK